MGKKETNRKLERRNVVKKKEETSFLWIFKILIYPLLFGGVAAFLVYYTLNSTPELPKIDPDYWWGPYPIETEPDLSIRPYEIEFSEVMISDLRERLLHTRPFVPPLEYTGFSYGFNSNFLTQVLDYWKNKYNFREREAFLNKYQHFVTKIQGLDIHYMHVVPKVAEDVTVIPLLMLHGWPGSIREFYEVIPMLTTPRPGYKFVFEIIAPSLPGYGFSQAPLRPGLGPAEMAVILRTLMTRISRPQFYIQGGDWGHAVGSNLATLYPENVLGFHTNTPVSLHPMAALYTVLGNMFPSLLVEPELRNTMPAGDEVISKLIEETGYLHLQATKPDSVGIALTDSPAGLAAYILEKFSTWTDPSFKKAGDGNLVDKFSLTHLLDNIMIYWTTNSITTSIRLYSEYFSEKQRALGLDKIPTAVPTWGLKFKHEFLHQSDTALRYKFTNYLQSTVMNKGGHFAAMEYPEILADDVFKAVGSFRQFRKESNQMPTAMDQHKTVYDFTVQDINGNKVKLDKYKGKVLIMVNVASQCGLTDTNYNQLNDLYEKYADKGLRILAFPCNQFNGQEPGSPKEILQFAKKRSVKFDLFEKVDVNGESAHPLWKFLKETQKGALGDFIKWNFSKFIVDRNGVPVERLGPNVDPIDLEPYLTKYL